MQNVLIDQQSTFWFLSIENSSKCKVVRNSNLGFGNLSSDMSHDKYSFIKRWVVQLIFSSITSCMVFSIHWQASPLLHPQVLNPCPFFCIPPTISGYNAMMAKGLWKPQQLWELNLENVDNNNHNNYMRAAVTLGYSSLGNDIGFNLINVITYTVHGIILNTGTKWSKSSFPWD